MNLAEEFYRQATGQLETMHRTQLPAIDQAADWFSQCLENGGWIYLFGTGHSHMLAEELFFRAGGLARVIPMLHPPLMLHMSASESTQRERDPAVAGALLEKYPIACEDVLVVASNSGRNPVPVELAIGAKERGARTIAIVNQSHSREWPSRHATGKKLGDVAELVIDNCGVAGDACVALPGEGSRVGAASTITGCMILQMIACRAVEKQLAAGQCPDIYRSSNGADEKENDAIIARYRDMITHL